MVRDQAVVAAKVMIRAAGATNAHAAMDMRPARVALDRHQGANLSKQLLPTIAVSAGSKQA